MFFLRFALLIFFALGIIVYIISTKIRSEFLNTSGKDQPLFRAHSAEFEAFCKNPPTEYMSRLMQLKKKLSIALIIDIIVLLLAILSASFG